MNLFNNKKLISAKNNFVKGYLVLNKFGDVNEDV